MKISLNLLKFQISTSVSLTTEIGLNLHFIAGIKSVNFGNLKSKGQIYTDVQTFIEDNTFFTSIKIDYFLYIFLFTFLFPSSLAFLRLLDSGRRSVASRIFRFFSRKIRPLVSYLLDWFKVFARSDDERR